MIRWLFLVLALALLAVGLLTVTKSPDWAPWQLAVLAGEFGHWLALASLFLIVMAWWVRGETIFLTSLTLLCGLAATVLFCNPAFQAWRIGASLPGTLAASFGPISTTSQPFSVPELFFGRAPTPVPLESLHVTPELPLDFYRAAGSSGSPAPCIVVVHGGGWDGGDRRQIPELNHWLARRGYAVAAVSYRLAPKFVWPAQRDDVLAAIAFLKTRASQLGIDATRLVVLGRSAGGQIAQTVGYTAKDPAIRGVVGLYAPSDLIFGYVNTHENDVLKTPRLMRQFLGGDPESAKANYESASALFHVTAQTPPTLLLHGQNDALTWYRHSVRLDARLTEVRVPHAFVLMPWATHAFEYTLQGPGGQLTRFSLEWFLAAVTK